MHGKSRWKHAFSANDKEPASLSYGIAIIPRSGSTWMGDILANTGALGNPKEWFNLQAARFTIRNSGCRSFAEYYEYLRRIKQSNDVFGFQVSYQHLSILRREGYSHVLEDVDQWFFLRRRDFVAQAVSLYRAKESGVFHLTSSESAAPSVTYDGNKILRSLLTLMHLETQFTRYFSRHKIDPVKLWYEDLLTMSQADIAGTFASALNIVPPPHSPTSSNGAKAAGDDSRFIKTGNDESRKLTDTFREEYADVVDFWMKHRGSFPVWKYLLKYPQYSLKAV